jgi:DNA ligase D
VTTRIPQRPACRRRGTVPVVASPFIELEVGPRTVKVTNPDKVYFSARGETKLDHVQYYISVGSGIVNALRERPCQLKRHPDGAEGEAIYQKRVPEHRPEWIEAARVTFPSGRHADELCVTELAAVAWAANLGTIDFHPWPSRRRDTERPDELRIDLDPQPGTTFADAQVVAGHVKDMLDEIGYVGWPKTSGNRGIHIYCRIEPNWGFTEVRRCALAFGRELERRFPDLVTTAWWKEERGAKIFLDYNQNARDRTIASAYSVRARPDACVSTPLTWAEVPEVETTDFTIATVPARFAALGDLHSGIDDAVCDLRVLLEWVERDERDRSLGEAPFPPNYPKMPGEPMRVQPSRARPPAGGAGAG